MGALSGSGPCGRAEAYYYDLLNDPEGADVPHPIVDHVRTCDYCHKRIRRLGQMLSEPEPGVSRQQRLDDSRLVAELQHHLEYIDRRVVCQDVKPFLPGMLVPSPRITAPTPISSHIDRCSQCSGDLRALGGLGLRPAQLCRLRDLYGAGVEPDSQMCRQSRPWIEPFGSGILDGIDPEVLEHLCLCPTCRARIYRYREETLKGDGGDRPGSLSCSGPSMAEVFDYVVPYGMGTAGGGAADRVPQRHIESCSQCRGMIQLLHRTVYGIAERADSNVGTVYSVKGRTQKIYDDCAEDASPDEMVCPGGASPVVVSEKRLNGGQAVPMRSSFKPYVKAAFLAAAMIPLAIVFHLAVPVASGLTVRSLIEKEILAKVSKVHVSMYGLDQDNASEELWYAQECGILIHRVEDLKTLYNVKAGRRITIDPTGEPVERSLNEKERGGLQRFIRRHLSATLAGGYADVEVKELPAKPGSDASSLIVYELALEPWRFDGREYPRRLRISVDPMSKLPEKIEYQKVMPPGYVSYRGLPETDDGYTIERVQLFEYPSEAKVLEQAEAFKAIE